VDLLIRAIESGRLTSNHFIYGLIRQQLNCILWVNISSILKYKYQNVELINLFEKKEEGRSFSWDPRIIHWSLSIQYHGGKKVLETLRGKAFANQGQNGHLSNDPNKWCLYLPGDSTLRGLLPIIDPYQGVSDDSIELVKEFCKEHGVKKGGIVFDEIEIRAGLTFRPSTKELIGLSQGSISEKEAKLFRSEEIKQGLATHILQLFFVSTDGNISLPLGFFLVNSLNGHKMFAKMRTIMTKLKQGAYPVEVEWTSSDGFRFHNTFLNSLRADVPSHLHFFDVVHILKNLRNSLLLNQIVYKGVTFNIHTLRDLRDSVDKATRQKYRQFCPKDPYPNEKMDMSMVNLILNPSMISALRNYPEGTPEKALGTYLFYMNELKLCFMENSLPHEERLKKINEVEEFFRTIKRYTGDMWSQIEPSLSNLREIMKR